jgi:Tyrosine phosphatase family
MTQLGEPPPDHTRAPKLVGGLNFRDMGGYATIDGRCVRWNKLYRSGTTHAMTSADMARIASFGIRFACDLRSNTERRRHRSKLDGAANIEYRSFGHDKLEGDLARYLQMPNKRPEQSRELMMSVYQKLPYDFREPYRALFVHLANADLPLVFNCAAGKDRTGIAAALVFTALGNLGGKLIRGGQDPEVGLRHAQQETLLRTLIIGLSGRDLEICFLELAERVEAPERLRHVELQRVRRAVATLCVHGGADRAIGRLVAERGPGIKCDLFPRCGTVCGELRQPLRDGLGTRLNQSITLEMCGLQCGVARQSAFVELLQIVGTGPLRRQCH